MQTLADRLPMHVARDLAFGVTDAGDPWCAILDGEGDVMLHIARIQGRFFVHAVSENIIAEGSDLPRAVARFASNDFEGRGESSISNMLRMGGALPGYMFGLLGEADLSLFHHSDPWITEAQPPHAQTFSLASPAFDLLPQLQAQNDDRREHWEAQPQAALEFASDVGQEAPVRADLLASASPAALVPADAQPLIVQTAQAADAGPQLAAASQTENHAAVAPPAPATSVDPSVDPAVAAPPNGNVQPLHPATAPANGNGLVNEVEDVRHAASPEEAHGDMFTVAGLSGPTPGPNAFGVISNFFGSPGGDAAYTDIEVKISPMPLAYTPHAAAMEEPGALLAWTDMASNDDHTLAPAPETVIDAHAHDLPLDLMNGMPHVVEEML